MRSAMLGRWAFIVGLVLAVVAGLFFFEAAWVLWVLVSLGVIVGLLNITHKQTQSFLLASIALALSATALAGIPFVGEILTNILRFVAAFVAAAMIVVALKTVLETGRAQSPPTA